jgi:putative DNA primase/helicase
MVASRVQRASAAEAVVSATTASVSPRYRVENFPAELRALDRWVCFQITQRTNGKTKKLPLIPGVRPMPGVKSTAEADNPATWRSFAEALADAEARGLYLAFAFGRDLDFFFIDADDVVQPNGTIRSDIITLRDTLDTFTEWSAREIGVHIIGKGVFPERCGNRPVPPGCKPLERYPLNGNRFCIFTGNVLPGFETIEERSAVLAALFPPRPRHSSNSTEASGSGRSTGKLDDAEVDAIVKSALPFWTDGRRHHMALYLSGELARQGVSREQAATIIEKCAADDSDPGAKLTACHDTYDDLEAGETVSGWYGLKEVCGLTNEELAPLEAILGGFWQRHNTARPNRPGRAKSESQPGDAEPIMAPAFPLDALPVAVRIYVMAAADSLGVPPEMVGMPIIGLAGAMVGNRVHLTLKNSWREFMTLYIAVVAPPGSAKTPSLNLAKWPLDALQDRARDVYRERLDAFEAELENWKQSGRERGEEKPKKPELRHYFSTDLTVEALVSMLGRSPGVAIVRDEIGGWVASMDQYRGGKGADRQSYLQLWSGLTIKSDRKSGESIYARNPVACVVGGIQPDLAGDLHDAAKRRDGFVERVLPLVPDIGVAYWTDVAPTTEQYRGVLDIFELLDRLPFADRTTGADLVAGVDVTLTREAKATWVAWVNENATLAAAAEGLAAGFMAKLPAHVARFALILHLLWNPDDPRRLLNAQRMEDAIELGEFCRAHIGRFLALLKSAAPRTSAGVSARVMRILRNANPEIDDGWVTRSVIYRGLRNVTPEHLTTALEELIESGAIEMEVVPGKTKTTQNYRIRISHYSHFSADDRSEAPHGGSTARNNANNANNANGVRKEDVRVAGVMQTFVSEDHAGLRRAPHGGPATSSPNGKAHEEEPIEASAPPADWDGQIPVDCGQPKVCQVLGPCAASLQTGGCLLGRIAVEAIA